MKTTLKKFLESYLSNNQDDDIRDALNPKLIEKHGNEPLELTLIKGSKPAMLEIKFTNTGRCIFLHINE